MLRPAIFLDRDGVINCNRADHVKSWAEFEFLPGSLNALRRLAELAWPVVVVSNQAIIGRGQVSRDSIEDIHMHMLSAVARAGGRIDAVMYCPHRPDEGCACRKPNPGLLLAAASALELDLARSFLVGDAATDVMAAMRAGCQPILVRTGRGPAQLDLVSSYLGEDMRCVRVAEDLDDAVEWVTSQAAQPWSEPRRASVTEFAA